MDRFAYTLRRLAQVLPVAIGVTIVTFLLVHLVPGDPAATVLGQRATPQLIAQLHKEWGLDRSLPEQYWLFIQRLAHGDLGDSLLYGVPVREMIIERAPVTLWLLAYSTVLSMLISVPLALAAARRKDGAVDQVVRAVPIVGLGMPAFWLGIMLILLLAAQVWKVFPVGGYGEGVWGHLVSMFLPALTVAIGTAPLLIRSLRASLLAILESDYVTTARAKGLPERRVLVRHALRNGIMPMITVLGINLAFLIGNTVVVEKVFALPGHRRDDLRRHHAARLRGGAGRDARARHAGRGRQRRHRCHVLVPRSARELRLMATIAASEAVPAREIARRRTFRNRWYRTPAFVAGATILLLLIAASLAAPLITRYDPNAQDLLHTYGAPVGRALARHRRARS